MSFPAFDAFFSDPEGTYTLWCVYMALQPPFLSHAVPREVRTYELSRRARVSPNKAKRALRWLSRKGYVIECSVLYGRRHGYRIAWYTAEDPAPLWPMFSRTPSCPTPASGRVSGSRQRARRVGAEGRHTAADIEAKRAGQNDRCFYCEAVLNGVYHVDHMTPLSRGGSNAADNLCLACPRCNLTKRTKTAAEFLAVLRIA